MHNSQQITFNIQSSLPLYSSYPKRYLSGRLICYSKNVNKLCTIYIYPTSSSKQNMTQGQFRVFLLLEWLPHQGFKRSSLPYYLAIVRERILGFILFSRVLATLRNANSLNQVWSHVTVSICVVYSTHNKYAYIHIYMQNTYWRNE